jgi:signal transduction histidine kinase
LLSLINYQVSVDKDTQRLVALADAELNRMSHITRQMLAFYRQSSTPVRVKLTELMEDVLELFVMRMRTKKIRLKEEKGTGLGLWVVRGIVAKHGGSIRLRSSTGPRRSGTVFSVFLPAEGVFDTPALDFARQEVA